MSQSAVRALRAVTAHGGGDHAGAVSPLSSSCDDLNRHIIRLLQDDGRNEHVHGQSDVAHIEVMTRIGMFNNQFLLERHVPPSVRALRESARAHRCSHTWHKTHQPRDETP